VKPLRPDTGVLLCAAAAVAAAVACGPSFRRTFQSDRAFTRCFDLDYRPGVAADAKSACWRRWLDDHVYNQPEDKIEHARLRLEEIANGISVPGPPGPPGAFHERSTPTRDAEEPVELPEARAAADGGPDGGPGVDERGLACEEPCRSSLAACRSACGVGRRPGAEACGAGCEDGYRSCMRSCFE
jgi:hypothetical protein